MPGCPWQGGLDSAARQRSHLARQRAAAPQSMHLPFARRSARRCLWAAAVLGIIPPVVRVKPILWTRQEPNPKQGSAHYLRRDLGGCSGTDGAGSADWISATAGMARGAAAHNGRKEPREAAAVRLACQPARPARVYPG